MQNFNYITRLENKLTACVTLEIINREESKWLMDVHLYYDGASAGKTSFTLHGYTQEEAEEVAQNPAAHAGVMKSIDEYLWGESDA